MNKKVFEITECTGDCPLRQTPAYDSQCCNFYGEDLDHCSFKAQKKKPIFCKVKRVIVEEET